MPLDTCACCPNLFGLDGADLVMIHKGEMGKNKFGFQVETRAELDFEKAVCLVNALMNQFNITLDDLGRTR